jgi:hypothetical protein
MKPTIFDLTAERRALEELLEATGGDITDPAVQEAFDRNADALALKVDSYAALVMDWRACAERARDAAKACKAKADALDRAADRMLERASMAMGPDRKELTGERWRLVRRQNPASVVVTDEAALRDSCPHAFREVTEVRMDKKAVKEALERNPDGVRGALLMRGERVEIKP